MIPARAAATRRPRARRGTYVVLVTVAAVAGCDSGDRRGAGGPAASTADILAARGAGEALLQQDRLAEAAEEFRRLIDMAPDDPAGYAGLGLIALRDGRPDDAETRLTEAMERAPEDPDLILALARLRFEYDDPAAARSLLAEALAREADHPRALWLLAMVEAATAGEGSPAHLERLEEVVRVVPGNLAARIEQVTALMAAGDLDGALAGIEALRQLAPDVPDEVDGVLSGTEDALRSGAAAAAREGFSVFRSYMEVTGPYQGDMGELRPPAGRLVGIPLLAFSSADNLRVVEEADVLAALRYAEASQLAGLAELMAARPDTRSTSALAMGDFDQDGDEDALWLAGGEAHFLRIDLGRFVDVSADMGASAAPGADELLFVDLDDDRRPDVYVGGETPRFWRQLEDGTFRTVDASQALSGGAGGAGSGQAAAPGVTRRAIAADLDQDGDLDVFEARDGPNRLFRNNGDWTFTDIAVAAGVAGGEESTRDVAFADIDDDRDLDLALAGAGGVRVLANQRGGRFEDETAVRAPGVGTEAVGAVALEDVDNDGRPDLLVGRTGSLAVFLAGPDGVFAAPSIDADLGGLDPRDVETFDFDNDGWVDVGVAGEGGAGLVLLRNVRDGEFEDAGRFLPGAVPDLARVRATDYNDDGDSDLVLLGTGGDLSLLRNDGGNANHFLRLDLMGLGTGSRKNNRFGIGARVEVRAGDLLQVRTVTRPSLRFGLDGRLKADVVRVEWPNGVAQDMHFPGTDQDLIEQQSLKGSCPLLYVWNGDSFEFVGDVMWKSALGMPMGILGGGERSYAPGYPSQEYRRLPRGILRPRDGEYVMQITEELWETIYVDDVDLVAVDHPDDLAVYVDERFVPPAPIELELWPVAARHTPVSAIDERGRDHLAALAARDFDYVSTPRAGRFQGIAEPHELVLDLGDAARTEEVVLFLTGWIFPTDASINVAMRQSSGPGAAFPALDVIGENGEWVEAIADLGFPSGKDKTVVVDLRGRFPTSDRRVRIRTNLMIYWDEAFFTPAPADAPLTGVGGAGVSDVRVTTLTPTAADLHYRGFSREFRKGGRYGPHWFDYETVSTEPKWSDLAGMYTRYGDVTELLESGDDMYVVSNAGDEITLRFDADALPSLPDGWTRTFLIYTDGWVKDGDLNTATGDRVEPLPFRGQSRYPYGADERYPADGAHRQYLDAYQTRRVRPRF